MPSRETDLPTLQRRFADFASTYAELPVYSAICRGVAEDEECAALLQSAANTQDRPVLWLAAVHDLVLREPDLPAARWYASVVGRDAVPAGDPWPDVRRTVLEHRDELRAVIASHSTQTNEVNRCAYLAPCVALAAADVPNRPLALVELGASAGLLLLLDRFREELTSKDGGVIFGDPEAEVRCVAEDRSAHPLTRRRGLAVPPISARVGLDQDPIDLSDADEIRWLEACLWPDVPGRIERFRAAVEVARREPPLVVRGDLVTDVAEVLAQAVEQAEPDSHLLVSSSWALTYVERSRRDDVIDAVRDVAGSVRAVSLLTAEPPKCVPGLRVPPSVSDDSGQLTVLGLHHWRDGEELPPVVLGTCHPHGTWVAFD